MRDTVQPIPGESFLVTLLSISSKTWVLCFSASPRTGLICDWLFLVFSGVSLETAANFFFLFHFCHISERNACQLWRLKWTFLARTLRWSPPLWGKLVSFIGNSFWWEILCTTPESYNFLYIISFFVSPIYSFSMARNIIVHTQMQCTIREKSILIILFIKEKCRLWREINTSHSISFVLGHVFSIKGQKTSRI